MKRKITKELMEKYRIYLYEQEKSENTITKYICDVEKLKEYAAGRSLDKALVIRYKEELKNSGAYTTNSINSFLTAANQFFAFTEWYDLKVNLYHRQKDIFASENEELTREEYKRLVKAAMENKNPRLALIIQTICATGIRVSELAFITVKSLRNGMAFVYNKKKERKIIIPKKLQKGLLCYVYKHGIKSGPVFQTKKGNALDRSYIWRQMKGLCGKAGVDEKKVFPHNLRHLFARTYYGLHHDIVKLAGMLGHSSIETTRIYLKESFAHYRKQLEGMNLLVEI